MCIILTCTFVNQENTWHDKSAVLPRDVLLLDSVWDEAWQSSGKTLRTSVLSQSQVRHALWSAATSKGDFHDYFCVLFSLRFFFIDFKYLIFYCSNNAITAVISGSTKAGSYVPEQQRALKRFLMVYETSWRPVASSYFLKCNILVASCRRNDGFSCLPTQVFK